jgi:hypothetical protein
MAEKYVGSYNYEDIFGDGKDGYKPSYLRDVIRVHFYNNDDGNRKTFISEREDQYEGFFSQNFQDQIEERTRSLGYADRERITREAVFEQANYNYTNKVLGNTGSVFNRLFSAFQTPDLFQSSDDSAMFGRKVLHEFTNYLKQPAFIREHPATSIPLPAKELDYKFEQSIQNSISTAHQSSRHINKDIADFQRRNNSSGSFIDYWTEGGVSKSKKLLDNVGYINRPGILPAIGMIHDADSELSINIYQLQNKPIIDYLTADLKSKAEEFREGKRTDKFNFNLQLAWNQDLAQNEDSIRILSPNIVAIRTFQALQEQYGEFININILTNTKRNHTKLLFSDTGAYISTQNQTGPVGKSLYQAGSNYETGRYVRNLAIDKGSAEDRAEGKIYQQIKLVHNRMFGLNGAAYEQKILSTGLPNVGAAVETYEVLKSSLAYLHKANNAGGQVRADFILDQVFLLQHDSLLFDKVAEGEMGPESKSMLDRLNNQSDYGKKKQLYRSELQEPLLRALIEGTATVITDPRNYRKNVQEPIFSSLIGNKDYIDSGYNLTKYLGVDPNSNMNVEQKIQYVMQSKGFSRDKAIQLLAIESGNIQPANVPRQHVKTFTMYELNSSERGFDYNGRKITPLSDSTNSSNMGLHSSGEGDTVNNELGTYHLHPDVRASSDVFKAHNMSASYVLNENEEYLELVEHTRNVLTMKDDLSVRRVNGQLQYTNVNNRAEYERSTDRAKLTELFSQLDAMNKASGSMMTVEYDFDNYGPIAVKVEVNSQLNYKFTYGQGFISEVNKSLVIGNSEFINQSSSAINLGFNQTVVVGDRITLSPIQTTMSMISSIALESEQIKLIKAPLIEYRENYAPGLDGNNAFDTGLGKYLLNLSGYGDRLTNDVLHKGIVDETSVVIGALTNLQARMKNTDPTLDKVRQLAGIDIKSNDRLANIEYLNRLIQEFAGAGTTTDRRAILTGEGLQAGTPNIKSFMATLFHSPEYADLLYDFVNSQGDPLYRKSVNDYVKEVSTRVYDPYLNRTQVSTYSSTQAYRQRPVYGVNQRREGFAESINRASAETQANLTKLGAFALAASPFEHDATSDLGKGNSLLYMPITGTGGSREKSGLEYSGYHNYAALHPYFQHKKIGTVTALDIIQDAGVGFIITRQGIGDYNQAIAHLGLPVNADSLLDEGEDTKLLFNFDVRKKASQIPQRIKNVIGSRPTRELTEVYQNLVEGHDAFYKGLDGNTNLPVKSINDLQDAYLNDLRTRVGDKRHLIDDSYSVGIEEGGQIRATLSSDLADVLEKVREDVNREFNDSSINEATRNEILRVRLVQADRSAHAVRGFIGSSKRQGDSVVLFQLSGAYSDYSILNPEFGGKNGMRTTFSDRAVKGQKSSQISSQRLLGVNSDFNVANEILVNSGDYIKRNKNTGLFHVYSFDGRDYVPGQVISNRKEASLLHNLIESVKVDPTFGNLNFTSNAASFEGVDAIEILKDIRILEGGVESNEIRVELNYNRTQKSGGGGRQESLSGGLAKMVPIYLSDVTQEDGTVTDGLLRIMFNQFNEQRAGSFGGDDRKLNFHQFYGVVNPSNLKSYFYEHGAKILIDQGKRDALLNTDGQKLAASLLMAFGTSKFGNAQVTDTGALDALGKAAASGSLGTFYKDQYVLNYIQSKGKVNKVNEAFVKSVKSISNLQVRTLEYIGIDLVTQALTDDKSAGKLLQDRLKTLLSDHIGNVVKPNEYVDIGQDRGRELSILAASLDYFVQLTEAKPHDIAVLDATMDGVAYRSLGTIGGLSYDELQQDKELLSNLVNQLGRRSYVVGMNMSMSGSQSKVAISSKLDSFIENQHLIWEPFYTDANKFKGGAVGSLRQLMAGFFGAMTGTHSGEFSNAVTKLQQIDILSPHARGSVFKSAMLGVYNDPGVGDNKFKELQRNYEMFEALHSVSELGNVDLIEKIIKVYRAKSDGQDIEPGKLNTHLGNIVKAAKGEGGNLTELIDQGRYYAFNHFERMYADFRLDPAKRTNAGQAISSGLQRSAGSIGRFAFTFPHLEFTDDGVKVYKDVQQHSFSLAGEDMKIIGESYGAVDNPLQKSQLIVWQAFAPGSAVGRIFDRIAATTDKVFSINDLSEEDYNKLSEFYTTATLFPDELTEALGVFANKTVGGSKVGFGGGTSTPAAWFMGSTTATILPEAILARHGGGNNRRMRLHDEVSNLLLSNTDQVTSLKNKVDSLESSLPKDYTKHYLSLDKDGQALVKETHVSKNLLSIAYQNRELLLAQMNLLKEGISPSGSALLTKIRESSASILEQLKSVSEVSEVKSVLTVINSELSRYKEVRKSLNKEQGDYAISLLGIAEMQILQSSALSKLSEDEVDRGEVYKSAKVKYIQERAEGLKWGVSIFDNLFVGINSRLTDNITLEELAGQMRRGSDKIESSLGLTYKNIAGLEGKQGSDYLNKIVAGVNQFATDSIGKLKDNYKVGESRTLAQGTINRLTEMRNSISDYSSRINKDNLSKHEVADLALLIQTDVERYHAEIMLSSDQANRPAPMGNPYSGRAIYDVFRLTDLNNLMSEYGLPISFTPVSGDNRNKTLHLFNPFSWLVAHGGDFDGDMITNMFRSTNQLSLKAKSYDALIYNLNSKIDEASLNKSLYADDETKQTEIQTTIDSFTDRRDKFKSQQQEVNNTITNITKHESVKEYQIAAAKWVGNYLKVDHRVFLGKDYGGFRADKDSLPPEVLFTFTEQGRGLFGGMEGIVSKSKDLFNDITALAGKVDTFRTTGDLEDLLANVNYNSGLDKVIRNDELRGGFLSDLTRAITQAGNDVEVGAAIHTANLFAAQGGAEAIQKYNLKGIDGASMTPAIFEAMEHTLGQAGSVILGKSYNTMVGMLYTEAPSLAMSYAVLNDPDGKLEKLIVDSQEQSVYDKLKAAAIASREKSEGMGSFLQSTQQILRDSIKPKDAIGYLDELDNALKAYKEADEEGRSLAYQSIVEKFGPGPGLKALIEMESLVLDGTLLNYAGINENELSKRSKTLEKYELTPTRMTELETRLGYNSASGEFDRLSPEVKDQIKQYRLTKEYVLAAYKTKQDMVSVVSDFAFDKGYNSGDSTGFSMKDAFSKALQTDSGLDVNRINELSKAAYDYVGSNDKLTYLAGLDSESQAFIEALTSRGLGKVESLSPSEDKFNKLWSKDLTSRQYAAHTWMETNKQFGYTVGEYGEMFIRFGAFNQARREAYASSEDVRGTYSGLDDPLAIAQLMAMTNGKVDPSMVGNLFNSLASAARNQTGNANPSMAEIYRSIGVGAGLNETDADRTMKGILLNSTDEVQTHLLGVARTMSIGQQTASIQDYVNSSQQNYEKTMSYEILKAHYQERGFDETEARTLAEQAIVQSTRSVSSSSSSQAFNPRQPKPNRIGKVLGSLGTDSDVKAQGFLFPLLGLVGSALSTGDLTPEAFQMAAGTALQNLSYVRWSNLEKNFTGTATNVMAGTAFKMRLALQESEGDAGKALWAATARELTMAGVATAVNTFAPKYIDRMLGGGETLDFDKYQSGRNLLTSTLSAIASTVIGMAINNNVVNKMVSPDASYVSKELAVISQQNLKAFNTNQEEREEDLTVEGVDGKLVYKQLYTWTNDTDYQLGMNVSESINFAFNTEPNTVYEFQLPD